MKDESVHPTGSLKQRLARSLFLYGRCNGWITERTTIVEASSGSTAISEAYFARFLELPYVAVMPTSTSPEKVALIEGYGGACHLVEDPATVYDEARRLADESGGYFLDQFTHAERASVHRGRSTRLCSAETRACSRPVLIYKAVDMPDPDPEAELTQLQRTSSTTAGCTRRRSRSPCSGTDYRSLVAPSRRLLPLLAAAAAARAAVVAAASLCASRSRPLVAHRAPACA
jgi:hypothetical protein